MSRHEVDAAVLDVANQLNKDYEGKEVVIVAVLKGAVMFVADLVRHLDFQFEVEFVRMTSHGKRRGSSGTISILKDISTDIRGKHVLVVHEIIDSGRKLKFLYDRMKAANPESVEVVSLLDKEAKRLVEIPVKYVGKKIDDQFLVGYGLDLEEYSRNLPEIYYLKYPN